MNDLDHTVIKPRPGRKHQRQGSQSLADHTVITPRRKLPEGESPLVQGAAANGGGDETLVTPRPKRQTKGSVAIKGLKSYPRASCSDLVAAASDVLAVVSQLRQITGNINVGQLHGLCKSQIHNFEQKALSICEDSQKRIDASYILCALVDEAVLNTAWGESSNWSQRPMLSIFHHETYGGERVYDILEQACGAASRNQEILELLYLALSLGFMGKLRVESNGGIKAEQYRSQLYELLHRSREEFTFNLSNKHEPLVGFGGRLHSFLPYWIFSAALILIAFGCYSYWSMTLNQQSDITRKKLADIVPTSSETAMASLNTPGYVLALRDLLADEIQREAVHINDYASHTDITLPNNGMFSSGSAEINDAVFPILDKIAKSLESIPGRITVSGHTDNRAIRTAAFPSNWHLSLARASSVVKHMSAAAQLPSRIIPQGKGAEQPVASNESAAGRAANRRVVITIYHTRGAAQPAIKEES